MCKPDSLQMKLHFRLSKILYLHSLFYSQVLKCKVFLVNYKGNFRRSAQSIQATVPPFVCALGILSKHVYRTSSLSLGLVSQDLSYSLIYFFKFINSCPKYVPFFTYFLGPSPRDLRTTIHWNVFPTNFFSPLYTWSLWKTVRTTFYCIIILQSRGEGPK